MTVYDKIMEQQKKCGSEAAFVVGEHLADILRANPEFEDTVMRDLDALTIEKCEAKIKEYADGHRHGRVGFVPPREAENIIRKFYGLPELADKAESDAKKNDADIIDVADFL